MNTYTLQDQRLPDVAFHLVAEPELPRVCQGRRTACRHLRCAIEGRQRHPMCEPILGHLGRDSPPAVGDVGPYQVRQAATVA